MLSLRPSMAFLSQKSKEEESIILNNREIHKSVITPLCNYLKISIQGKTTLPNLYSHYVGIAVEKQSPHSFPKQSTKTLKENSLRHHLKKINMDLLLEQMPNILWYHAKQTLDLSKKFVFAIDYTMDPYYGDVDETNERYVIRGKHKKSTNSFYAYASISIVHNRNKYTLAVFPVEKGVKSWVYVKKCIEVVKQHNIQIEAVCLDRGFYAETVIGYLEDNKIRYIIPSLQTKKVIKLINGLKKQGFVQYTMNSNKARSKRRVINIAVVVRRISEKIKTKKPSHLGFITNITDWYPRKICEVYEHRFSIESTYRTRNDIRVRTSTKNPAVRFFFALISFLIQNVWVFVQIKHFTKAQRGPKVIVEDMFPLSRFLSLIKTRLNKLFKRITEVVCLK